MRTLQQEARVAGGWYLLLALSAPLGLMVVPDRLWVAGNPGATVENLRAMEGLVRLGLGSELFHQVVVIFLTLAFYRLFKDVHEELARQVVILGALVSVPIMFVNTLNTLAALILAKGGLPMDQAMQDGLAFLFLRLHGLGITVASVFWGLWLFPLGRLVLRCGFIPRIFGVLLLLAGGAYLVEAFHELVLDKPWPWLSQAALRFELGEVPIVFWLLIRGAQPRTRQAEA